MPADSISEQTRSLTRSAFARTSAVAADHAAALSPLSVAEHRRAGATVLGVHGEIDLDTAPKLATRLDEVVRNGSGDLVIDLSETDFIDSAGLHVLLNAHRRLTRQSRRLAVVSQAGPVRRLLGLSRLLETLGVVDSLDEYERRAASRAGGAPD